MSKKVNYFAHDYGARNDTKLITLRRKAGMEGLGIFWALVEMLYESGGELDCDDETLENLAYEWRCDVKNLKIVIFDCNLFFVENEKFYSKSVNERLKKINEASERGRKMAEARWQKNATSNAQVYENDAQALPMQCTSNAQVYENDAQAMQIKKEINKKINKENYSAVDTPEIGETVEAQKNSLSLSFSFFQNFWEKYPRKTAQNKAEDAFFSLTIDEQNAVMSRLPKWLEYWKNCDLCFVPYPEKFLREKKFFDTIPTAKNPHKTVVLDTPNNGETFDEKRKEMQKIEERDRTKIDAQTKKKTEERAKILAYFATLPSDRQKEITRKIKIPKIAKNGEILLQNGIILALRDEFLAQTT